MSTSRIGGPRINTYLLSLLLLFARLQPQILLSLGLVLQDDGPDFILGEFYCVFAKSLEGAVNLVVYPMRTVWQPRFLFEDDVYYGLVE